MILSGMHVLARRTFSFIQRNAQNKLSITWMISCTKLKAISMLLCCILHRSFNKNFQENLCEPSQLYLMIPQQNDNCCMQDQQPNHTTMLGTYMNAEQVKKTYWRSLKSFPAKAENTPPTENKSIAYGIFVFNLPEQWMPACLASMKIYFSRNFHL